jgi:hypothetical protein
MLLLLTNVAWTSAHAGFVCPQSAVCAMAPLPAIAHSRFSSTRAAKAAKNSASAVRQLQSFSQTEGENHELLT